MGISLGLLVLFQGYWLRSVYREQKELLETDLDNLFSQNIRDLQDSLFRNNWLAMRNSMIQRGAFIQLDSATKPNPDSATIQLASPTRSLYLELQTAKPNPDSATMQRSMNVRSDSIKIVEGRELTTFSYSKHPRKPETRLERRERFFRNTVIAFKSGHAASWASISKQKDTLQLPLLTRNIQQDMKVSGLSFPFSVTRSDTVPDLRDSKGIVSFHSGGFPPIQLYVIEFFDYHPYLLQRMSLNFLFALVLLGITTFSFNMIFNSLRQQQKLARLKNDFISNITHELKTPIATVSVALEALHNFQGINNPERTKEYLNISQHELQRLSIMVDRVLKMSMFENNALQLHPERFDMHAALQKVLQSMRLQFERSHAQVIPQIQGNEFLVRGDAVHLTNVIYNLLDNALKYSPKDPAIQLSLSESNGNIQFAVRDNGIGIPKEYQDKVFEQFFRVPQKGQQHNTKGYGLGLSYVAEVIQKHNGNIRVESTLGQGSTFTITLPKA